MNPHCRLTHLIKYLYAANMEQAPLIESRPTTYTRMDRWVPLAVVGLSAAMTLLCVLFLVSLFVLFLTTPRTAAFDRCVDSWESTETENGTDVHARISLPPWTDRELFREGQVRTAMVLECADRPSLPLSKRTPFDNLNDIRITVDVAGPHGAGGEHGPVFEGTYQRNVREHIHLDTSPLDQIWDVASDATQRTLSASF